MSTYPVEFYVELRNWPCFKIEATATWDEENPHYADMEDMKITEINDKPVRFSKKLIDSLTEEDYKKIRIAFECSIPNDESYYDHEDIAYFKKYYKKF